MRALSIASVPPNLAPAVVRFLRAAPEPPRTFSTFEIVRAQYARPFVRQGALFGVGLMGLAVVATFHALNVGGALTWISLAGTYLAALVFTGLPLCVSLLAAGAVRTGILVPARFEQVREDDALLTVRHPLGEYQEVCGIPRDWHSWVSPGVEALAIALESRKRVIVILPGSC